MRILFCNFHEGHGGGQDTYLLSLIKALRHNHRVALASPASSRLYLTLQNEIPCMGINYKAIFRQWRLLKPLRNLTQWVEKQRFDIIHVNGSADHRAMLLMYPFLQHRPKLILTKHNALRIKWGALLRMRYFTDAVIAVSQSTEQHLSKAGLASIQIRTIPNGIDTDFYKPLSSQKKLALRQQYGLCHEDFIFVSNAGTAHCKNWPSLLDAITALPSQLRHKIKVIIAGQLPSDREQANAIKKFDVGQHLIFTGLLDDTRDSMRLGDVGFVLSNTQETISFACREMMAMGLPVIVSNYGGLPENVTDQVDGWIVPVDDIPALTQCIQRIITQTDLTPMARQAREKAIHHFNNTRFIEATLRLYQDIVSPPAHH